jgi:repressor LexA
MYNNQLTIKQKEVLATIKDLIRVQGKSPTLEEIRKVMGYKQTSSVQRHIEPLLRKKYLTNEDNQARSLKIIEEAEGTLNIPLVGNIACGKPIYAEENVEAYIPYPKESTRYSQSELFFLRAVGDSMDEANIKGKSIDEGDYILVHVQNTADIGQPVVALIGDEATIKIFNKDPERGVYTLLPKSSNPNHKPIFLFENLAIQGVAIDVIKPNF